VTGRSCVRDCPRRVNTKLGLRKTSLAVGSERKAERRYVSSRFSKEVGVGSSRLRSEKKDWGSVRG